MGGGAGNDGEWSYSYTWSRTEEEGSRGHEGARAWRQQATNSPAGAHLLVMFPLVLAYRLLLGKLCAGDPNLL